MYWPLKMFRYFLSCQSLVDACKPTGNSMSMVQLQRIRRLLQQNDQAYLVLSHYPPSRHHIIRNAEAPESGEFHMTL